MLLYFLHHLPAMPVNHFDACNILTACDLDRHHLEYWVTHKLEMQLEGHVVSATGDALKTREDNDAKLGNENAIFLSNPFRYA
mmetsp:Transcript_6931/g.7082  ORF Transcript_6931/g.7082 Transcript_6931/m.7082 type:complete len:83 (-) Transcript_6931:6-254(-)